MLERVSERKGMGVGAGAMEKNCTRSLKRKPTIELPGDLATLSLGTQPEETIFQGLQAAPRPLQLWYALAELVQTSLVMCARVSVWGGGASRRLTNHHNQMQTPVVRLLLQPSVITPSSLPPQVQIYDHLIKVSVNEIMWYI